MPLLVVIIPNQILQIVHQPTTTTGLTPSTPSVEIDKGSAMGTTLLFGSLASVLCAPVFGSFSDSSQHKMVYFSRLKSLFSQSFSYECQSIGSSTTVYDCGYLYCIIRTIYHGYITIVGNMYCHSSASLVGVNQLRLCQ
jgi:hypothetical protein